MENTFEKRYTEARRKIIESEFAALNPMQREAVLTTQGPLLILAGAGSGKTTALINRIANIIQYGCASDSEEVPADADEEDLRILESGPSPEARALCPLRPVRPERILAITFTNKAADELKNRLSSRLGEKAEAIWARTFHSACVRILRREADKLGYPNNFAIYDSSDSKAVLRPILSRITGASRSEDVKAALSFISKAKSGFKSPEAAAESSSKFNNSEVYAEIYEDYNKRLFAAGAMDFDDLLYNTVRLFYEHKDVLAYWQKKFDYILVDEYQDTNKLQYLIVSMLAERSNNICVVGDDDQSIYKFRGATIENILTFEKEFRGCRVIRMEQNYRSTGHILSAANSVIKNNTERKGKTLWTSKSDGSKLVYYSAMDEDDEADFVVSKILESRENGENFRDNAVLYRLNALSNRLEFAFRRSGIPYRVFGGMKFFDRAEIKDMLSYLCVICSPSDDLRLTRIINVPQRGIGDRTVEIVKELASANDVSMYDIISNADKYRELDRPRSKLLAFSQFISRLHEDSQHVSSDEIYKRVLDETGYLRMLSEKKNVENATKKENVEELKSSILRYIEETGNHSLSDFLDEVALYSDTDDYDSDRNCAVMMTMHAAKGLEFDNVFVIGMEENIFPDHRCANSRSSLEEERRLCYVAMTRARKKLFLSGAENRMLFGQHFNNEVSRFEKEIPKADIDVLRHSGPDAKPDSGSPDFGYGTEKQIRRRQQKPRAQAKAHTAFPTPSVRKASIELKIGDNIIHKSFGTGVVRDITPMGGDALLVVDFDTAGQKRLMLNMAQRFMTKTNADG